MMTDIDESRSDRAPQVAPDGGVDGPADAPRDVSSAGDPVRDVSSAGDPVRDVPSAGDPVRDVSSAGDPVRDVPSAESRNFGAIAHLSAFIALAGVPSFIGPLVVWLLQRDRDHFVAEQAREALNFNLSLLIYAAAAVALSVLTIGLGLLIVIPAAIVAAVGWLVVTVLAAIRAADGRTYRYPLTLRLIS